MRGRQCRPSAAAVELRSEHPGSSRWMAPTVVGRLRLPGISPVRSRRHVIWLNRSAAVCRQKFAPRLGTRARPAAGAGRLLAISAAPVLWTSHGQNWTMDGPACGAQRRGPRGRLVRRLEFAACEPSPIPWRSMPRRPRGAAAMSACPSFPTASIWRSGRVPDRRAARARLSIPADVFCVTRSSAAWRRPKACTSTSTRWSRPRARSELQSVAIGSLGGVFGNTQDVTDYARRVMTRGRRTRFLGFIPRRPARLRDVAGRVRRRGHSLRHRAVRAGGAGGAGLRRPGHRLGCGRHP